MLHPQTRQAGSLLTVDTQTSFHLIFALFDFGVSLIQSPHCADWHSKHLSVRICRCPPPGYIIELGGNSIGFFDCLTDRLKMGDGLKMGDFGLGMS